MDLQDYVFAALFVGLFAICIITATLNFSLENKTNMTSTDNSAINEAYINLSRDINTSLNKANEISEGFTSESKNPILDAAELVFKSIFLAGQTLVSLIIGVFNSIGDLSKTLFYLNPIVINTLLATLVIGVILAVWALYKIGR